MLFYCPLQWRRVADITMPYKHVCIFWGGNPKQTYFISIFKVMIATMNKKVTETHFMERMFSYLMFVIILFFMLFFTFYLMYCGDTG